MDLPAHAGTGDRRPSAGGTGIFAGASGTGTGRVDGSSLAQRNPDGGCSMDLLPKHERDAVSGSGTLTFSRSCEADAYEVPAAGAAMSSPPHGRPSTMPPCGPDA